MGHVTEEVPGIADDFVACSALNVAVKVSLVEEKLKADNSRSKAYTTGIFLKTRVIETLLLRQGLAPAIALVGLVWGVLLLLFGCLGLVLVCCFHGQAHPIVDKRRR